MDSKFNERAFINQQGDPLTGGEFLGSVLRVNLVLAAAKLGLLAASVEVFDQRAKE